MKRGYARVSTADQTLDLQLDALAGAGCQVVYRDQTSAVSVRRPGLARALAELRPGDVLVVWRLDRLARNIESLLSILSTLSTRGVAIESLTEAIETRTPGGQLLIHVLGALSQFERGLLRERVVAGMAAARLRGVRIGRPAALRPEQAAMIRTMRADGASKGELARLFNCGRRTVQAVLQGERPYHLR